MNISQNTTPPEKPAIQTIGEPERIKYRILIPLIAAVVVLLVVFILTFLGAERSNASRLAQTSADETQNLLNQIQKQKLGTMVTTIESILNDDTLARDFKAGDREALLKRSKPLFDALHKQHRITHYYFHTPQRVNLLRVHRPEQLGDTINRQSLKDAQRTGQIASGIERGPLGTFVLRVVSPWRLDGQIIGYIELGVEYEDIIKDTHGLLDVDFIIAVYKKFLDQDQWNKSLKTYGKEGSWDQFPNTVVMDKTINPIPTPIAAYLSRLDPDKHAANQLISWDNRDFQVAFFPLNDIAGKTLGEMIVLQDVTLASKQARNLALIVAFICLVVGALLVGLFYLLLGRIENSLARKTLELRAEIDVRKRAEHQLHKAHEELEERVRERTRELETLHVKLQEASRRAGMAEVATNVLHNVGNVLNSVNVAATLITDTTRNSRLSDIALIVGMLQEHQADLGAFLTTDPRGKQITPYLKQLSEHLTTEQGGTLAELESLRKNIDHIKMIVGMQQSYARVASIKELISPVKLIQDSLRMTTGDDPRQTIQVIRDFHPVGPIHADKHKVLQILVNIVRNAVQSCVESPNTQKRITLRIAKAQDAPDNVEISVTDSGIGIAPENLNRIFNQGFTTKKDGHGFGLHSAAIAAKEMGGSLSAHSQGPGTGATFTLTLPSSASSPAAS